MATKLVLCSRCNQARHGEQYPYCLTCQQEIQKEHSIRDAVAVRVLVALASDPERRAEWAFEDFADYAWDMATTFAKRRPKQ